MIAIVKWFLSCCGRVVKGDNKPIWCIKCGEHDIEVTEFTEDSLLPCPFCGGKPQAEALDSIALYWYECSDCTASSGGAEDWVEARKNWNMRK